MFGVWGVSNLMDQTLNMIFFLEDFGDPWPLGPQTCLIIHETTACVWNPDTSSTRWIYSLKNIDYYTIKQGISVRHVYFQHNLNTNDVLKQYD